MKRINSLSDLSVGDTLIADCDEFYCDEDMGETMNILLGSRCHVLDVRRDLSYIIEIKVTDRYGYTAIIDYESLMSNEHHLIIFRGK